MASMKLGSKPDVFLLDGSTWLCSTGLPSDVVVQVEDMSFHLHKFPLLSRSQVLGDLIREQSQDGEKKCTLQLRDLPGGSKTFLLVVRFCYGVKIELNSTNVISLRCAAEYLHMTEDYGDGNLIAQTETFLVEVYASWSDSLKALETCEEVLVQPLAEDLHIMSRCINALAMKACANPRLFSWPMSGSYNPESAEFWNGIHAPAVPQLLGEDWWHEDASSLKLSLYKRLILAVASNGMNPENIVRSVMHYAKKHLQLVGRESGGMYNAAESDISLKCDADRRHLLEELVGLLPEQKGAVPSNFLLRLLRTAMILHVDPPCRDILEKRIGSHLDQVALEDLMIPNIGYYVETLYDIDCVQRMLNYFMLLDRDDLALSCVTDGGQSMGGSHSLTPIMSVANLIDGYLAEVAPDVNLKPDKFQSIAAVIPDYARSLDDGIYRAIDIYLKAHPWLIDSEREQICRLMNCQKLSLEASTHAAQNERLPIRVIVQVLFFEQLRLRKSVAGWFFISDSEENPQNPSGHLALATTPGVSHNHNVVAINDMKGRVSELEKECLSMKGEIEKMIKSKGGFNVLFRRLGFVRSKLKTDDHKKVARSKKSKEWPASSALSVANGAEHQNGEVHDQ